MNRRGYSDPINHALAFAAKHHDQQVRRANRPPYFTQPANVAIMLTRFGCDEETVVAGILHEVVADYLREGYSRDLLVSRVGEKFGARVVETILMTAERRVDAAGVEMTAEERRADVLERLERASAAARWIAAANAVHAASTLLADLRRTVDPESVWSRFTAGREGTLAWYRRLYERLRAVGFGGDLVAELGDVVAALEAQPVGAPPG
ncbi:MAG TPA: HD domain-containing protein [Gemmatimonadaceae bacterium]|nr:HD domain-containing protein [Gemmatimonadaceae bacterium]